MRYLLLVFLLVSTCFVGKGKQLVWNVHLKEAGTLGQFSSSIPSCIGVCGYDVKITGTLNEKDFKTLSDLLASHDYTLDLSEAELKEIPDRAFLTESGILIAYLKKIILPSTLTTIQNRAFLDCSWLREVDLSRCTQLNYVGDLAFGYCKVLSSLDFSNCSDLKILSSSTFVVPDGSYMGAFYGADLSEKLILPPNLEIIGNATFYNCNLNKIEIPSSVKEIQDYAFYQCNTLYEGDGIKMYSYEPPIISDNTFDDKQKKWTKLKVPSGSYSKYKKARYWSDFLSIEEYNPKGGDLIYHTINVSFDNNSWVSFNSNEIESGFSSSITDQTDIKLTIGSMYGYHLKQVIVGSRDMTNAIEGNVLILSAVSEDLNIQIVTEPDRWTFQLFYDEGGTILKDGEIVASGSIFSGETREYINFEVKPKAGFYVITKNLESSPDVSYSFNGYGGQTLDVRVNGDGKSGIIKIAFKKDDCKIRVNCNGGVVKLYDGNGNLLKTPSDPQFSVTVKPLSDIKMDIHPFDGYHFKSVEIGGTDVTDQVHDNVLMITSIYEDKEIEVFCEADAPNAYQFKINPSEGGIVRINDTQLYSGWVSASTDVKVTIIPDKDYYLKQLKIGEKDVTEQVEGNELIIPSISKNIEIFAIFEKGEPTSYTFQVSVSSNGEIEVGGKTVRNGNTVIVPVSGTKLEFFPDNQYYPAKVILGSKDITNEIVDNVYNITSVSSDMSLSVTFERNLFDIGIKTIFDGENGTLGSMKIGDRSVTCYYSSSYANFQKVLNFKKGSTVPILFLPNDKYFELKKVTLDGVDITAQAQKGNYQIQSINSDLRLDVEFKRKFYTLTFGSFQGIEKIEVNKKDYFKETTRIELPSGKTKISVYLNNLYYIKQALLSEEKIYERSSSFPCYNYEVDIDGDKELMIVSALRNITTHTPLNVIEPGTLKSLLTDDDMNNMEELSLSGAIDQRDFAVINQMKSLKNLIIDDETIIVAYGSYPANTVPEKAFFENQTLENLSLNSSSIDVIGNLAFASSKIYSYSDCGNAKKIGEEAFKDCMTLEYINFLNATDIGKRVFDNCVSLQEINISNLERIQSSAFNGCTSLKNISLQGNIKSIGEKVFSDCKNLEYLYINSETVPDIVLNSFNDYNYNYTELKLGFDSSNNYYLYIHHAIWSKFKNIKTTRYPDLLCLGMSEYPVGGNILYRSDAAGYEGDSWSVLEYSGPMIYRYSRVEFFFSPNEGYSVEAVILNGKEITNTLDENNKFIIPSFKEDVLIEVKFKKEEKDHTANKHIEPFHKRVYRSAPKRLCLSGFDAGVPVYIYDAGGRLVITKTVRESLEKVDLPASGLYFVRTRKESFKVIL